LARAAPALVVGLLLLGSAGTSGPEVRGEERGSADGSQPQAIPVPMIQREEVRFVTLDVVVEERVGIGWRPARDLRRDQVKVLVGGREMALDLFENACRPGESAPVAVAAASANGPGAPAPVEGTST